MIGGALGAALRFGMGRLLPFQGQHFPWATFWVNGIGCLMIGLLIGYLEKKSIRGDVIRWLWISGFCGGFTTFSAFSLETITLFQNDRGAVAIIYALTSVGAGLLLTWIGWWMMRPGSITI
jgi:CrcB protein